uniref:Uncharacterized protein n=1 Tax=Oryctolagus cuniculus TaxID=9986 RepID=A0A5F9CW70_RABIT
VAQQLYRNTTVGNHLQETHGLTKSPLTCSSRFCQTGWTFALNHVEIREVMGFIKVGKMNVVACDGGGGTSQVTLRELLFS